MQRGLIGNRARQHGVLAACFELGSAKPCGAIGIEATLYRDAVARRAAQIKPRRAGSSVQHTVLLVSNGWRVVFFYARRC
ncbi:hypothetical protein HC891_27215 [Candidatus Gracilibacteria bacterium]|nr:hypothetical protein [Candidatus Gracilibacteria bacterium]